MRGIFYNQRLLTYGTGCFGELEHFGDTMKADHWRIVKWKVVGFRGNQGVYHYTTVELVRPRPWFKLITLGIAR